MNKDALFDIYGDIKTVTEHVLEEEIEDEFEEEFNPPYEMCLDNSRYELLQGICGLSYFQARDLTREDHDPALVGIRDSMKNAANDVYPENNALKRRDLQSISLVYMEVAGALGIDTEEYFDSPPAVLNNGELEDSFRQFMGDMSDEARNAAVTESAT